MFLRDYSQFGSRHSEAGALKNVLEFLGIVAPHDNRPFSEALLFGIGGGIGLGYSLIQTSHTRSLVVGTRITTTESAVPGFLQSICERLGANFQVQHSSNSPAAEKSIKLALASGVPLIVWVEPGALPYYGTPFGYHTVVVYGLDEVLDQVMVADRSSLPLNIKRSELNAARENDAVTRFRALLLRRSACSARVEDAIQQGLAACCEQMRSGFGPANLKTNFGLKSLEKWAAMLIDDRDEKCWKKLYPTGLELFETLSALFDQIENRGNGGSALRILFADFLVESAAILNKPELRCAADQFLTSSSLWSELAEEMLPESVSLFSESKRLQIRRRLLFEERGTSASAEINHIDSKLFEIKTLLEHVFPLTESDIRDLLSNLSKKVLAIHRCESRAVSELEGTLAQKSVTT